MQNKQKKILAVDDEPDILGFLQELLEQEGYAVAITGNVGTEWPCPPLGLATTLEKLYDGDLPDLILMDALLAQADGIELVKQLKSHEETRHIPIIMFSAHPTAKATSQEAGADDFIAKPFDLDELIARITKLLKRDAL